MRWHPFNPQKGYRQKRPPIGRFVLVQVRSFNPGYPDPIIAGYRKNYAGVKSEPYFVRPGGAGLGDVYQWCDCLPDGLQLWQTQQGPNN